MQIFEELLFQSYVQQKNKQTINSLNFCQLDASRMKRAWDCCLTEISNFDVPACAHVCVCVCACVYVCVGICWPPLASLLPPLPPFSSSSLSCLLPLLNFFSKNFPLTLSTSFEGSVTPRSPPQPHSYTVYFPPFFDPCYQGISFIRPMCFFSGHSSFPSSPEMLGTGHLLFLFQGRT